MSLPFDKQHGKHGQTLFKSLHPHRYDSYRSVRRILSLKKSLLVICKILRLLVNTLAVDDKYSLLNRDNLTHSIQMQLSQEQKAFSEFFSKVLKSRLKFENFQKKDDPLS